MFSVQHKGLDYIHSCLNIVFCQFIGVPVHYGYQETCLIENHVKVMPWGRLLCNQVFTVIK